MTPLTTVLAYGRSMQLSRELRRVQKALDELNLDARRKLGLAMVRELKAAAKCHPPHFYQTPDEEKHYRPWGAGTTIAMSRLESSNPQVRLCGMALWLTVVYFETAHATLESTANVHRAVLRIARGLREVLAEKVTVRDKQPHLGVHALMAKRGDSAAA